MTQSRKERSCCCHKLSYEVSGDGDRVADKLNPYNSNQVAVKRGKLVEKVVAKSKLEALTGGKDKSGGDNKENIGRLVAGILIKREMMKRVKEFNSRLAVELNKK